MLGYLEGKVLAKHPDTSQCVLLCGSVGYEIHLGRRGFDELAVGSTTHLWIHSHVREDAFTLFGFATESEKRLYRILLSTPGLGPKTAMSLLDLHGANRLVSILIAKDTKSLTEAPGVGSKLAQKIVLELSGKAEKLPWVERVAAQESYVAPHAESSEGGMRGDLTSALVNLGYQPTPVKTAIDRLMSAPVDGWGFGEYLRAALQSLANRVPGNQEGRSA